MKEHLGKEKLNIHLLKYLNKNNFYLSQFQKNIRLNQKNKFVRLYGKKKLLKLK